MRSLPCLCHLCQVHQSVHHNPTTPAAVLASALAAAAPSSGSPSPERCSVFPASRRSTSSSSSLTLCPVRLVCGGVSTMPSGMHSRDHFRTSQRPRGWRGRRGRASSPGSSRHSSRGSLSGSTRSGPRRLPCCWCRRRWIIAGRPLGVAGRSTGIRETERSPHGLAGCQRASGGDWISGTSPGWSGRSIGWPVR